MHHSRLLAAPASTPSLPPFLLPARPIFGTEVPESDLLTVPFPVFVRTIADLLTAIGYQNVRLAKPMHSRGRNAHGGLDVMGTIPSDTGKPLVIVQTKQYHRPVPRSFVDELRGAMIRLSARQGVLITTSTFSLAAQHAARAGQHVAPIRLIDGKELTAWLQAFNVPTARQPWTVTRSNQHGDPALKLPINREAAPMVESSGRRKKAEQQRAITLPIDPCIEISLDVIVRAVLRDSTAGQAQPTQRKRYC